MKVKGTVRAWTTEYSAQFDEIGKIIQAKEFYKAVGCMAYLNSDMSHVKGWTEVGIATITVEFFPREAIVSKQIEGLREQLRQHRVNAENAEQAILSQISNLMAITG